MSLITQCPACSTMFRIVPDQLRISEGWVRCGQCDEVFDANAYLHNPESPVSTPEPVAQTQAQPESEPAPEQVSEPRVDAYEATVFAPMLTEPQPAYDWGAVVQQQEPQPFLPEPPAALRFDPEVEHWEQGFGVPQDSLPEPSQPGRPLNDAVSSTGREPAAAHEGSLAEQAFLIPPLPEEPGSLEQVIPIREAAVDDPLPSFMATGTGATIRHQWAGKKSVLLAVVMLAGLLAIQVLMLERDRLAAASPGLRPLLVQACGVLACTVSPMREIESIAIDSSAFLSIRPGVYLLQATLKNRAASELATPALELTLTDTQDRPLLRRVLLPAELGAKPIMAAGSELGAKLPISVKPGAVPEKIAGYKLFAFYP